jgi:hypothetical protein
MEAKPSPTKTMRYIIAHLIALLGPLFPRLLPSFTLKEPGSAVDRLVMAQIETA